MSKHGLIGRGIGHTQFKLLHSLISQYSYEYEVIDVQTRDELISYLEDENYGGFNIAPPFKIDIIKYLDDISEKARTIGVVNVVKRMPDGRLKGYNTDVYGFRYMVGGRTKGRKCIILGTGAAARSIAYTLDLLGAERIILVSRYPAEARESLKDVYAGKFTVIGYDKLPMYYDSQVIINATPVGQMPDIESSPITDAGLSMRIFSKLELAVDLIYNPYRTKFLQDARRLTGCKTMSGLEMLILQAMETEGIWFEAHPDRRKMLGKIKEFKREILKNQLNVVVVGMPGSGKTTVFRRFAYENKLDFIDVDEEVEKLMGEPIETVLSEGGKGEEYFRQMEHQAVLEACRHSKTVIATGGGSILNPISRDIMRCNGIVIYMKRPIELLKTKGRPLSQKYGVQRLFEERDGIYKRVADFSVFNSKVFGARRDDSGGREAYNHDLRSYAYFVRNRVERHINDLANNRWT